MTTLVRARNLSKRFGKVVALDRIGTDRGRRAVRFEPAASDVPVLELSHRKSDRGLCHVQCFRRLGEA